MTANDDILARLGTCKQILQLKQNIMNTTKHDSSTNTQSCKGGVSGRAFEEFHCQKDYITDTVTVQFRGDFDKEKAIEYMLRCYPSFEGREVIELSPNDFYMGLENIGYAVFQ